MFLEPSLTVGLVPHRTRFTPLRNLGYNWSPQSETLSSAGQTLDRPNPGVN